MRNCLQIGSMQAATGAGGRNLNRSNPTERAGFWHAKHLYLSVRKIEPIMIRSTPSTELIHR